MIAPARQVACELLCRIELEQAHSDDALHSEAMHGLSGRDRNLVTEIVYGTLRWRAWLDYLLAGSISRPWDAVDQKMRIILRLSVYQMTRMDRIPDHAVINDAVDLAKGIARPGAGRFVNGVLRNLGRGRPWTMRDFHRDCPPWVSVSLPQWLWKRWEARFGVDAAMEYALALNRPPRTALRLESPAAEAAGYRGDAEIATELVTSVPGAVASEIVPGAWLLEEGKTAPEERRCRIQDEASQIVPFLLGDLDGARVWDACAAPGGKSVILRDRCGRSGLLVSSDLAPERAMRMRDALARSGVDRPEVLVADAAAPMPFRTAFDAVVADVPCSGLGTLRRNPEIKWRCRPERLIELGQRQGHLLEELARAVKPGGLLLYSTCSTEPEENELVIERFLNVHPEFRIRKPDFPRRVGDWLDQHGMFRSFPSPRLWDGFFATLMVRMT